MGRSAPLQKAHPLGGKFQLITLISPRNGCDMRCPLASQTSATHYDGKTPKRDRIKLTARNGIILSWGCEPPVVPSAPGSMLTDAAAAENWPSVDCAQTPAAGLD